MKSTSQKVSLGEKIGYSLGDGAANLVFQMTMMFQLFLYGYIWFKATTAGLILLIAGIVDAFIDPGRLSDRTNTLGKISSWSYLTAVPFFFCIGFICAQYFSGGKVWYAGVTFVVNDALFI